MHTLVVGTGAPARNAAIAGRRAGADTVTLIRADDGQCGELTRDARHAAAGLQELAEAGVTAELDTRATFVDTAGCSVWVDCGEHEEVIAYEQLIVCAAQASACGLLDAVPPDHAEVRVLTC